MRACAVLWAVVSVAGAFNLDPRHSMVIRDPRSRPDSLFGYAQAFWMESTREANRTWLVVGAPGGPSADLPGSVFRCVLQDGEDESPAKCQPMTVPASASASASSMGGGGRSLAGVPARRQPGRDWLGASVAVEDTPNGAIAACAPRAEWMLGADILFMPGECYAWTTAGEATPLAPLASVYKYAQENDRWNGFLVGLAQEGMSAHFVKGPGPRKLLVGAPGVEYWKGSHGVYEWNKRPATPTLRLTTTRELKSRNPYAFRSSYYGYAVSSARLQRDGKPSLLVAAPRADGEDLYTGLVRVSGPVETTLEGQQMGEFFGFCLAALDLDGDGVDDLVAVGAPLGGAADRGRLYVYANKGEGRLEASGEPLGGSGAAGARFGSSVAGLGDINRDGYSDLAVGAPLEGAGGAVYIYLGDRRGGVERRHSQRLAGTAFDPPLSGFGVSLAAGVDVDGNSFNDLAVGASGCGAVAVLLARPVVALSGRLFANLSRLALDSHAFTIDACLRYTSVADTVAVTQLTTEIRLRADESLKRAVLRTEAGWAESPRQRLTLTLARDVERCQRLHVVIKRHLYHVVQPIEIFMEARILDDSSKDKDNIQCDGPCPMADPSDPTKATLQVPFAHGCQGQSACHSDLKVTATTSNNGAAVVVGRDARVCVYVTVAGGSGVGGDPAYLAMLGATLPGGVLLKTPSPCALDGGQPSEDGRDSLSCPLANPLKPGQQVSIDFELDLRRLSPSSSDIIVNLTAWSASEELRPQDNNVTVKIPVTRVSQITITGLSVQNYLMVSTKRMDDLIMPVYHRYEVVNHGPSPVEGIKVQFQVPVGVTMANGQLVLVAKLPNSQVNIDGKMVRCDVDAGSLTSLIPTPEISHTLHTVGKRRRTRRETQEGPTSWRVLQLNCSGSGDGGVGVQCVTVTCPTVNLPRADLHLQLYYNASAMALLLNEVDDIQLFTRGLVKIEDRGNVALLLGNSSLVAEVSTDVFAEVEPEEIDPWVLPLAIALGLFSFLLLVLLLTNIGFFKREMRQRLETIKGSNVEDRVDREELLEPMNIY